jgi:hypothetical protein
MFDDARGRNQARIWDEPFTRRGVELWMERALGFYGDPGGIETQVIDDQIGLNAKTRAYCYGDFTPLNTDKYVQGSRPLLESVVNEVVTKSMTTRQKALALMIRCRDNHQHGLKRPSLFYGGSEEDLLRRGAQMCNEISRVYACLCQIAGIPARCFSSHISGHMMNEICVDGKWWWIDVMMGLAPVDERDEPVSAWDLHQDPTLFERQPKIVWESFRSCRAVAGRPADDPVLAGYWMAKYRDCYFNPREAVSLGNLFAWDYQKYTYPWIIDPVNPERLERARRLELQHKRKMGWPDFYFNEYLFDEKLKMRPEK